MHDGAAWRFAEDPVVGGRGGRHTADLDQIIDALQLLRRADPEASW
jgi:hypothetical protein